MADHFRTLDEILNGARQEPPVVTLDDVQTLLSERRAGRFSNRFNWRRYAMLGLLLTTASVIALVVGTPTTQHDVGMERVVRKSLRSPIAAAPLATTSGARVGASTLIASTTSQTERAVRYIDAIRASHAKPTTTPTTGSDDWGYRFVKGQKLRYRYVSEYSQPGIEEWFTNTRIVDIFVESVEPDGRATLVITTIMDSMDMKSAAVVPEPIEFSRPKQAEMLRGIVSRYGRLLEGQVVRDSRLDSLKRDGSVKVLMVAPEIDRVRNYLEPIFPLLPENARLRTERQHRDTILSSYEIPSFGADMQMSMATIYDTTRKSYTLIGPRKGSAGTAEVLTITSTKTSGDSDRESMRAYTTVDEIHLRTSDGIPTRAISTTTSSDGSINTSSLRATLELVSEVWVGPSNTTVTPNPEVLD